MAFRASLDQTDAEVLNLPGDIPIYSGGKVTIRRDGDRTVVEVGLAPEAFRDLEAAAGGQIELQVVPDEQLG